MLSDEALRRALERAGLDAPVRFEEVTPSTQQVALALAHDGAPEWTLVAAAHQTQGRGRLGRTWSDVAGSALMFSIVLRPPLEPDLGGLIPLLAGAALADACDQVAGQRAACKWPNDVLVGGRKAAGILAESRVEDGRFAHVVLGVGVNLGGPPAEHPDAGAVDAEDRELLEAFVLRFAAAYRPVETSFAHDVVARYRGRCATLGRTVRATTIDGAAVEGEAIDVDASGALVVRTPRGERTVRFGAVEHLE